MEPGIQFCVRFFKNINSDSGSATDSKTQHPIFDLIFTNQNQNPQF
jgi:hypothetical protein